MLASKPLWSVEYDNYGNGGFSEWWDIKYNGRYMGRFDDKQVAEQVVKLLNEAGIVPVDDTPPRS